MTQQLAGRVAIVTGGGWNVGRGVACALAAAGSRVVVASRTQANLDDTVRAIEAAGGCAVARQTDVTECADVEGLVRDTLSRWGQLDIFAAIAGGGGLGKSIEEVSPSEFRNVFDRNVMSTFYSVRAALPPMREQNRGTILTCSGGGSYYPVLGQYIAPYASAKAAICRLTDQLTAEYWETELRFNCIDPGLCWDPTTRKQIEAEEARTGEPHPQRLVARRPEDAGELAVWLCSDESAPLRGRCVSVFDEWWRDPAQADAVHASINRYRLRRDDL